MKHSTQILFSAAVFALITALPAGARLPIDLRNHQTSYVELSRNTPDHSGKAAKTGLLKSLRAEAAQTPIWRPATETIYVWTGEKWEHVETYSSEFYPDGKPKVEFITEPGTREVNRTSYEYNAAGYTTLVLEEVSRTGKEYQVSKRDEAEYDSRLDWVTVKKLQWVSINGALKLAGNCFTRTINRNDDGNIISVEIATLYNGDFDPSERLAITYGEDGKASVIKATSLTDNNDGTFVWKDSAVYSDIIWENTDGQIYSTDILFSGNNRIKSAKCVSGADVLDITIDYIDDKGSYNGTYKGLIDGLETTVETESRILDDFGSESLRQTFTYIEDGETYVESYFQAVAYDSWGYQTLYEHIDNCDPDNPIIYNRLTGEIDCDPETGLPATYTVSQYNPDTDKMEAFQKVEFSNYVDAAGINDITADATGSETVYYNLQGIRVNNPTSGLYIIRQGNTTRKAIIR